MQTTASGFRGIKYSNTTILSLSVCKCATSKMQFLGLTQIHSGNRAWPVIREERDAALGAEEFFSSDYRGRLAG